MSRRAYKEKVRFGEGEPATLIDNSYEGIPIKPRSYKITEVSTALFAISTLLWAQGHYKRIAHELAAGFNDRLPEEIESVHAGDSAVSPFFDYDLDDLTDGSRSEAVNLYRQVEICSNISDRMMSDIGSLPLWKQGITLYGVSDARYIHLATLDLSHSVIIQ